MAQTINELLLCECLAFVTVTKIRIILMKMITTVTGKPCLLQANSTQVEAVVGSILDDLLKGGPHVACLYGFDMEVFAADQDLHARLKDRVKNVSPYHDALTVTEIVT